MDDEVSLEKGRILALDLGARRIGVALSDPGRIIAQAWRKFDVRYDGDQRWMGELEHLIKEEKVTELLVGLPLHMSGEEGIQAENARKIGEILQQKTGCQVNYSDERLTTVSAERTLIDAGLSRKKRKEVRDSLSAQVFLQSYLDGLANQRE